ncbi:MAG TPA: RagB/SusD family nutrient uptake outer membrane protein [Gemmatimonadaceae bacterium]|nr:RagB/SusD family nutrient uptake outer membrane protein [Gemmatimonadaceae bacterium]
MMMPSAHSPRVCRNVLCVLVATAVLGGCSDFLKVTNPGAINADNLNNPQNIALMVNGVIGEFQPMLSNLALYGGVFSDELRNDHVFFENRDFDKRTVAMENGTMALLVYNPIHRSRFLADSVAGRLKVMLGDSAVRDVRLARVDAYGGYNYIMLGEYLCSSPVNVSALYTSGQITNFALPRLREAIVVATAAKAQAQASAAVRAAADSLVNLANVGLARAYLQIGRNAEAIAAATQVPVGFEFRVLHSDNSAREYNPFENAAALGVASTWISLEPKFQGLGDVRVPSRRLPAMDTRGDSVPVPSAPESFSTYAGTLAGALFTKSSTMRFASYLEAQYIIAEAQGPTQATLDFVNSRRAVGGQAPSTAAGDALMADLRDQRRRDFFLDGHRLGDMRRYLALHNVNEFSSGPYPGTTSGETYGTQTCFPITITEFNNNPNIPK